jgi:hypothetical protein
MNMFMRRLAFGHGCYLSPEGGEGGGTGGDGGGDGKEKTGEDGSDKTGDEVALTPEEIKAIRKENAELKKKFDDESRASRDKQEADLRKNKQFKELAETYENENKDLKKKLVDRDKAVIENKKFEAIKAACDKLGLLPAAVSDLDGYDFTDITVETTSLGRINVLGADKFAERLKTLKPHWFKEAGNGAINPKTGRVLDSGGKVSVDDVYEAEKKFRKSGSEEDKRAYHDLAQKYQKQRAS